MNFRPICILFLFLIITLEFPNAWGLDQIIRPYQSVRSAGMGGVRMTTGLYDENFFNNPARITANPESKFTVLEMAPAEITPNTWGTLSSILGGQDALTAASNAAGQNMHARVQIIFPAYYLAAKGDRRWALAFAFITSTQIDAMMRQSYQMSADVISDTGPSLTFGRKFLKNDALSIGATAHFTYRVATAPNYSILNYVQGTSLNSAAQLSDGSHIDFDLGTTYKFAKLGAFEISFGGAIQNILGGAYSNTLLSFLKQNGVPPTQPRSYGIGFSALRPEWGHFKNTVIALEATDVLNNTNGSVLRLIHLGAETNWKSLAIRLGLNQGYITAGLGLDVHNVTFNFATYGEEMGLNAGTLEDRRYTFNLGFHI